MKKIVKDCQLCKIRSSAIFSSMNEQEVKKLNDCKTTHEYKRGQVIFYEGNPSLAIYCVHSGVVKLFKTGFSGEEFVIRLLGPGEIIGFGHCLPTSISPPRHRLSAMPDLYLTPKGVF